MTFRSLAVVALAAAATPVLYAQPALKTGEQVYRETCMACHGPGLANAPRMGDAKAWGKLIGEGQAVLTAHGWVGIRAMPPKGGRNDLSLEEFARAVAWMARNSGGKWQDPDARMMDSIRAEERKRIEQLKKTGKG
uniref:c-type cytochrome n=1 Tax=Hylemonella sp. TaxID=2066020 RepID=UPI0035B0F686